MIRVLIVDDHPVVREGLVAIFEDDAEIQVIGTAGSAADAIAAAGRDRPDVVLLDLMMPNMDGWRFLEELRSRDLRSRVRVVIVSAMSDTESIERGQAEGVHEHVAKPFDASAVVRAVEAALQEEPEKILARRQHPEDLARLIDKLQSLDG